MINLILNIIITAGLIFGAFNYVPLTTLESVKNPPRIYGATITTIAGSDTLSSSRTTINDNFSALNDGKIENSTTSVAAITTLSNLVSIGTITTGTWSADAIGVSKGGTGTTTISTYQVLLGDGANGVTVASSTGTTGQFLTSNGAGSYPSWQSSTVNQTDNYLWTGNHNFTGTTRIKDFNASSTSANPIVLNGVSYDTPSTQGASSTVLKNDGSGSLAWQPESWTLLSRTDFPTAQATNTVSFQPRVNMRVRIYSNGNDASGSGPHLSFNSANSLVDTSNSYGYSTFNNYTQVAGSPVSSTTLNILGIAATSSPFLMTMDIYNATSTRKFISYTANYQPVGGIVPMNVTGSYIWSTTTTQMNAINLTSYRWGDPVTNWIGGMVVEVYGGSN